MYIIINRVKRIFINKHKMSMSRRIIGALFISGALCTTSMPAIATVNAYSCHLTSETKVDTLSYITGMQVASEIENNVLPQFRLDYETIVGTIKKYFDTNKPIKVEDITITPENINELAPKYFNKELQTRIQAAMSDESGNAEVFTDPKEKNIVSTMIGADFAYRISKAPYSIEKKSFMKAIEDIHKNKAVITKDEANRYMQNYFTVIVPKKNKADSEKWLAGIEKQKGVKKTDSGILYKIEIPGDMNIKANKDQDIVKVLYTGCTKDGKVFDSNRWSDMGAERKRMVSASNPSMAEKNNPIEFPLNRVIKGWTEGMKLIGKGGKITLWIPAELAYGERGAGNDIGPNEALRFDVELLEVTVK